MGNGEGWRDAQWDADVWERGPDDSVVAILRINWGEPPKGISPPPDGGIEGEFDLLKRCCEVAADACHYESNVSRQEFAHAAVEFFSEMLRRPDALEAFAPGGAGTIEHIRNKLAEAEERLW